MKINKFLTLTCVSFLSLVTALTSCQNQNNETGGLNPLNKGKTITLDLLNWEDYIYCSEDVDLTDSYSFFQKINNKTLSNDIFNSYFSEEDVFEDYTIDGFTLYLKDFYIYKNSYIKASVIVGLKNLTPLANNETKNNENARVGFAILPKFNESLEKNKNKLSSEYIDGLNEDILTSYQVIEFNNFKLHEDDLTNLSEFLGFYQNLEQFDLVDQFKLLVNYSEDEEYIIRDENNSRCNINIVYDTFDTNETMYNSLKTGKSAYDLICPSEYMIQKLAKEGLIKKINSSESTISNYDNYASKFLKNKLSEMETGENLSVNDYTCGYMWGTLGILFNPNFEKIPSSLRGEEVIYNYSKPEGYETLWNMYKDIASIKDSMRDSYAIGILHAYYEDFKNLYDEYYTYNKETFVSELKDGKTSEDVEIYNKKVNEMFNRVAPFEDNGVTKNPLDDVSDALISLKGNIFGFEVDSGKNDIITGKIGANIAWSGDAVYSMDTAEEENNLDLYFAIPDLGSNIWFDGWCKTLACEGLDELASNLFLNFISDPQYAALNMDYIGYTPFIAGDDIFNLVNEWYNEGEEGDLNEDGEALVPYDINYFFDGTLSDSSMDATLFVSFEQTQRQLLAQYPSSAKKDHLAVMQDFGKYNSDIVKMWERVKANPLPIWVVVILIVTLVGGFGFLASYKAIKKYKVKKRKALRNK